ncbi:MAG: hypothetical protein OXM60_00385 [Defluviicoccus sp.]|nr:hypothetical protein [Defluviicoccus sp.]
MSTFADPTGRTTFPSANADCARGAGIFDPRVDMSRNPSVAGSAVGGPLRVTAGSVTMAVA